MAADGIVMAGSKRRALMVDSCALPILSALYGKILLTGDVMLQIDLRSLCVESRSKLCTKTFELYT